MGKSWVLRQASRRVNEIVTRLGVARIKFLIENNKDLSFYLEGELHQLGKSYSWAGRFISDEDFLSIIPPWVLMLVAKYGDQGEQWLKRQLALLREFIT